MKPTHLIALLGAIAITAAAEPTYNASVFSSIPKIFDGPSSANHIRGIVKGLAVDEDSDRVVVRVMTADNSQKQVTLCPDGIQSALKHSQTSGSLNKLRTALQTGSRVDLQMRGPFNRCLKSVALY